MRKWVVVGVVLLVVVAGVVGFALWNLNGWLERNREWVAAQVSQGLGRQVEFDEVGVTLWPGFAAQLENLRVADDPAFAPEPFLRAGRVRVAVRVIPALFGRVEVRYVTIVEPEVTLIRTARGLNVSTLGASPGAAPRPPEAPERPPGAGAAMALSVGSLRIDDGVVRLIDRTATPPAEYVVRDLDVRASDLSPTAPVTLEVAAAVLGAEDQNVRLEGTVGPATDGGPVPVDLTLALDDVPPASVSGTVAVKATAAVRGGAPPALTGTVTVRGLSASPAGGPRVTGLDTVVQLRGESAVVEPTRFEVNGVPVQVNVKVERLQPLRAAFTAATAALDLEALGYGGAGVRQDEVVRDLRAEGTLALPEAGPEAQVTVASPSGVVRDLPYEKLEARAGFAQQVLTLQRLAVASLGGTYEGSGRVHLADQARPRFESRSTIRGMSLPELLQRGFPAAAGRMQGRLDANLGLAGAGRDWDAIRPTVEGQGRMDVRDGVLREVNIAESVLGGVTGIAGLSMLVPPDVRAKYPDIFGTDETRFEALGGSVRIGDQRLVTDDLRLAARDYAVDGRGGVTFDGRVDFTATLVASERLTADIVKSVKEAKYLTNSGGRVAVPFRMVGTMPGVKPVPDTEWVARTLARAAVGSGVDRLLDEVAPKPKPGKKQAPERELLRKGLEGLFGR